MWKSSKTFNGEPPGLPPYFRTFQFPTPNFDTSKNHDATVAAQVKLLPWKDMPHELQCNIFNLCKSNMKQLYDKSNFNGCGWSDSNKMKELKHRKARYLVALTDEARAVYSSTCSSTPDENGSLQTDAKATDQSFGDTLHDEQSKVNGDSTTAATRQRANGPPHQKAMKRLEGQRLVGFVHFRLERYDETKIDIRRRMLPDIVYLYELQIDELFRKRGLGSFFIEALEAIGLSCRLIKIVCTALKDNQSALTFYMSRCNFAIDKDSPEEKNCEFLVLSKEIKKSKPAVAN